MKFILNYGLKLQADVIASVRTPLKHWGAVQVVTHCTILFGLPNRELKKGKKESFNLQVAGFQNIPSSPLLSKVEHGEQNNVDC